ncbi:MAG: tRNA (adenosine(37)-N6)-threonylcarbamoyltransferase complex transferase subunit TsaD [Candidatus Eisenbacteria bacterium]|nr:tRNA (adenosine(37)-N6)-threonylcarbamoyltransferase complex transferase subunit TsaD [Candidatus Eisenbacteria bacterium]
MSRLTILGIETSCDDVACAIVRGREVLSSVVSSQEVHKQFGGVVPELASRAHLRLILPVLEESLKRADLELPDVDAIAVTSGPGLIGSLLVGLSVAKGIAFARSIPIVGVNHIEAHLLTPLAEGIELSPPFVGLAVSGGHTEFIFVKALDDLITIGSTRDDAAGEAFDKAAKLLALGYPGGPEIDKLSREGNRESYSFPRAWLGKDSFDVSFSGLKTALRYLLASMPAEKIEKEKKNIAASFQEAIVDVLVTKLFLAAEKFNVTEVVVAGGVASNSRLREEALREGKRKGIKVVIPSPSLCMDNAVMVAIAGALRLERGERANLFLDALPTL